MSICEDCILFGRCYMVCGEVDGGIDEYFAEQNDECDYVDADGE